MTSLFRNISEKHDGHMRISFEKRPFLRRDHFSSGGGAKLFQPAERRWNVLGKNCVRHEFRFTPAKGEPRKYLS